MELAELRQAMLPRYERLARIWLDLVLSDRNVKVTIIYHTWLPAAVADARWIYAADRISVVRLPHLRPEFSDAPDLDFLLRVKLPTMKIVSPPFIWLDLDALPLAPLSSLGDLLGSAWLRKLIIGTGHQHGVFSDAIYREHGLTPESYLNSGVLVVGSMDIIDIDEVYRERDALLQNGCSMPTAPYYDDLLLSRIWRRAGLSFRHIGFDQSWNSWSRYTSIRYLANERWTATATDAAGNFIERVNVVHYYGEGSKPWHLNCKLYLNYENTQRHRQAKALQLQAS